MRAEHDGDGGAAAVEFALVLPVLLLIVFATIQYGFFFFQSTAVVNAAGSAARQASLGAACGAIEAGIRSNLGGTGVALVDFGVARTGFEDGEQRPVTVDITWEPTTLGLPLLLGDGPRVRSFTQPAEPAAADTGGC